MKNSLCDVKTIATSVVGSMHVKKNMPCQDYFVTNNQGKNYVAVLSDGAGSAKYGKIGAKVICQTIADILKNSKTPELCSKISYSIEVARKKLLIHRLNKSKSLKHLGDFAATLVGLVYCNGEGYFFHIGDGAAIGLLDDTTTDFIASRPENGDFSCETFFYTQETWQASLRITPVKNIKTAILMSDGLTNFAFNPEYTILEAGFVLPIHRFLLNEKSKTKAIKALANTLNTPKAQKLNSDDKTFLWARLA